MASWFECKVRYDKLQENGAVKKVTDVFLADSNYVLQMARTDFPDIRFHFTSEF